MPEHNVPRNGKTASILPWAFVVTIESQERVDTEDLVDSLEKLAGEHPEILSIHVEALGTIRTGKDNN